MAGYADLVKVEVPHNGEKTEEFTAAG